MYSRFFRLIFSTIFVGLQSCFVCAQTNSDSETALLETERPYLASTKAISTSSIEVSFSEAMWDTGLTSPGKYSVVGTGIGTLATTPDMITGNNPVTLHWSSGEMLDGARLTLKVVGVQDALGNPINTTRNTKNLTGIGEPPIFGDLVADPAVSTAGDVVVIRFSSSELLDGGAEVTINGNSAMRAGKSPFTYVYTILESDPGGPAEIEISGFDLAGNFGVLLASDALTVYVPEPEMALSTVPAILTIVGLVAIVLSARARIVPMVLVTLALASSAMAARPSVSNVTFVQQPSPEGTEVVITYDLVAPNGPCRIRVALSRNGGLDSYSFPVNSVSGDVIDVTTGTGKRIVWLIASDYPNQRIPQARLRVTAFDGFIEWHSIDTLEPRGVITVSELLRVNQFQSVGAFHCQEGTEDGYAPGPGDQSCPPHDLDYAPQDWSFSLSEVLRAIQFYNTGGYSTDCDSEDGFAAGIGPIFDCEESKAKTTK